MPLGKTASLISDREHHHFVQQLSESEELDEEMQLRIEQEERRQLMKAIADKHKPVEVQEEAQVQQVEIQQFDELRQLVEAQNQQFFNQLIEPKKTKTYDLFGSDEEDSVKPEQVGVLRATAFWDEEGYYLPSIGDIINGYSIIGISGKGVFASVMRASKDGQQFAIKILRTRLDVMRQSGEKERAVVSLLNKVDPNDRKHIIRLRDSFEFKTHLCLVYECLQINLRETLTQFGKGVGLSLEGVCLYSGQLFTALSLLHKLKYIHADLKPDNIMVSKDTKTLKLCDFGSVIAFQELNLMKSAQIVSPFYRPPEVILGYYPLDGAVDVWSAAVTLFELYTGKFMFPGTSNNHLLALIMRAKGKIPAKMLKKAEFWQEHISGVTGQFINLQNRGKTEVISDSPESPIIQRLKEAPQLVAAQDLANFADLIERCTAIDPSKRITAEQALLHPFINMLRTRAILK